MVVKTLNDICTEAEQVLGINENKLVNPQKLLKLAKEWISGNYFILGYKIVFKNKYLIIVIESPVDREYTYYSYYKFFLKEGNWEITPNVDIELSSMIQSILNII